MHLARKTIIPTILIFITYFVVEIVKTRGDNLNIFFIKRKILSLVWDIGKAGPVEGKNADGVGMLWFLIAFFFAQCIYLMIKCLTKGILQHVIVIVVSLVGFIFGKYFWLPFNIDVAMVTILFIHGGVIVKNKIKNHNNKLYLKEVIVYFAIWAASFFPIYCLRKHYLILALRSYPLFPISLLTAFAGTMFIISVGKKVSYFRVTKIINLIGEWTLTLFIIHALDIYWEQLYNCSSIKYLNGLLRVFIDVAVLFLVKITISKIKKIKNRGKE